MSPAISPVVSALERAAVLIEKGVSPGKALRQVAQELGDYADAHAASMIPARSFSAQLGEPQRRAA